MKEKSMIDVSNSLKYRDGWTEGDEHSRSERIVYLSEQADGTLAGTEKMTRKDYYLKQKQMRMAMKDASEGLFFAVSAPAVAYRAKVGMMQTERQYGRWVVWEVAGPRFEGRKEPAKKRKVKKD